MSYKFYNANALGLFQNDCTVRAISLATGNTWDDTYEHLSTIARLQGTMMDDRNFIINYLDERYDRLDDIPFTVGEVAGEYPENVLLITMNNHITCAKFGIIFDSFDCRDKLAEFCWIVK